MHYGNLIRRGGSALLCSLLSTACVNVNVATDEGPLVVGYKPPYREPRNIIMVVADGMGPVFPAAYRHYKDNPETPEVEETVFDRNLVGMAATAPHQQQGRITDSAAAATAFAAGVKTYNKAIGVDIDRNPVDTVLEAARERGMKTGLAVTSEIVHATPAAYVAKNESRENYNAIADDFFDLRVDGQFKVDVMLGGGRQYLIRQDRNLVSEFVDAGYQYIDDFKQLTGGRVSAPLLGLFAESGLEPAIDSADPHRLATMTGVALDLLENDDGFFLLVEASQVDWGAHVNDLPWAMGEMDDLAETLLLLESYVASHPDTLVVVTADHNTGGFSLGRDNVYEWEPRYLDTLQASPQALTGALVAGDLAPEDLPQKLGFPLSAEQLDALANAGDLSIAEGNPLYDLQQDGMDMKFVGTYLLLTNWISEKTVTGWTSGGHTGGDVPVYAFGAGAERFAGFQDNTDIAEKLFEFLDW